MPDTRYGIRRALQLDFAVYIYIASCRRAMFRYATPCQKNSTLLRRVYATQYVAAAA